MPDNFDYLKMPPECSNSNNSIINGINTLENSFRLKKTESISSFESMDQVGFN